MFWSWLVAISFSVAFFFFCFCFIALSREATTNEYDSQFLPLCYWELAAKVQVHFMFILFFVFVFVFVFLFFSNELGCVSTCTCVILSVSTALLPISSFVFHTFHGAINNWADAKVVSCSFSFFVFFFIFFSLSLSLSLILPIFLEGLLLSSSLLLLCVSHLFLLKNKTQILTGECPTRTSIYHAVPSERSWAELLLVPGTWLDMVFSILLLIQKWATLRDATPTIVLSLFGCFLIALDLMYSTSYWLYYKAIRNNPIANAD